MYGFKAVAPHRQGYISLLRLDPLLSASSQHASFQGVILKSYLWVLFWSSLYTFWRTQGPIRGSTARPVEVLPCGVTSTVWVQVYMCASREVCTTEEWMVPPGSAPGQFLEGFLTSPDSPFLSLSPPTVPLRQFTFFFFIFNLKVLLVELLRISSPGHVTGRDK